MAILLETHHYWPLELALASAILAHRMMSARRKAGHMADVTTRSRGLAVFSPRSALAGLSDQANEKCLCLPKVQVSVGSPSCIAQ